MTTQKESPLRFDEATHTYWLDGKRVTGVTTVLGVIAKPALIGWAAREATAYVKKNKQRFFRPDFSEEYFDKVLTEASKAYATKRDKSADIGTRVHSMIESFTKGEQMTEPETKAEKKMVDNFIGWANENKVKFLASEQRVYSREHWYAGTYDFLCEIDGKKYVGDLKTSNAIYGPEFFGQMAAYQMARAEMQKHDDIDARIIVRCGKNGTFETRESFNYEHDKTLFLSALNIYRVQKKYEVQSV